MAQPVVTVIGGGLAGSECAYQLTRRGIQVVLREMKPQKRSPAHQRDTLAELVCSNSFRSDNPESAIGMLHSELRRMDSLILRCADHHRVPAGDALAVDRELFSDTVTQSLQGQGGLTLLGGEVEHLPDGWVVVVAFGVVVWAMFRLPSLPPIVVPGRERPRAGWAAVRA